MMKNPWKTLSVNEVYDNPWITVTHREVVTPTGSPGIYGLVHFKNIAIAIVPIDDEGFTWLVGQYRYTIDQYSWEVPEGGGKLDLPPLESAKRELLEETGISAGIWIEAGMVHLSNSVTDEKGIIFIARDLSFGTSEPEETELLEIKKVPFETAVEMALSGEITDAFAVIAILKAKIMMERGEL